MAEFTLVPERTALLNIDMQNCFVEDSPVSSPQGLILQERINRLTAVCRRAGILVIHTRHVIRADGSNLGVLAETAPPVKNGIVTEGSKSAEFHPGLVVEPGDVRLDKPRFGAFTGTDLELILRSRRLDTVIVSGIATNVCCETTAREAAMRDFRVIFLSDGTATRDLGPVVSTKFQLVTCATLGALIGQVLTVEEVIARIERARPARTSAA